MTQTVKHMTLDEIDKELAGWQTNLGAALTNCTDLMDTMVYKWLTGNGLTKPTLQGVTAAKVNEPLHSFEELWGLFSELTVVLNKARDLRKALPRVFNGAQLLEIAELIDGPSIKITTPVPFAQRSLLTQAEATSALTPKRVLESMVKAHDDAKSVILEVDQAMSLLGKEMQHANEQVADLKASAAELGAGNLPELDSVNAKVAAFDLQLKSDPLGVKAGFDQEIGALIKQVEARLDSLKKQLEQVKTDLAQAHKTMTSLKETHAKAKAAVAERELKVAVENSDILPRAIDDSVVVALETWLAKLDETLSKGEWKPLRVGVANWSKQATERLSACATAYAQNIELVNERRDLKGFLDALTFKALKQGRGEDPELTNLASRARDLLHTRPAPLAEAKKLVTEYADKVR